jgi:hypothetical protein
MNAVFSHQLLRILIVVLLALVGFFVCVPAAPAAAFAQDAPAFHSNIIYDLLANRSRMIQVSLVIVGLGCAIMWWYR